MGGPSLLFFLFLFPLPPILAVSLPPCPADEACFALVFCNGAVANVTTELNITCPATKRAEYLRLTTKPIRRSEWKMTVRSPISLSVGTLEFSIEKYKFSFEKTSHDAPKFKVVQQKKAVASTLLVKTNGEMRGDFYLKSSTDSTLLEQLMNQELTFHSSEPSKKSFRLDAFWTRLQELTRALPDESSTSPTHSNNGSNIEHTTTSNSNSVTLQTTTSNNANATRTCESSALTLYCSEDCNLKVEKTKVNCPANLWVDLGNAFLRKWKPVNHIVCNENTWKWKEDGGTTFHPIEEKQIACSAEALPQATAALYGTIGGSIAILFIVFGAIAFLRIRYLKKFGEKTKIDTQKQQIETDKESTSTFGIAIDPSKLEQKTWNWPENTNSIVVTATDTPTPEVPKKENMEFVDVTSTTGTGQW